MRHVLGISLALVAVGTGGFLACSSGSSSGFMTTGGGPDATPTFNAGDSGGTRESGLPGTPESGMVLMSKDAGMDASKIPPDGSTVVTTKTTIYAHTDTELYSMDAMMHNITDLGTFTGMSGSYYDSTITDLAVDAAGELYVNTEQVIYKAALPATPGPGAKIQLTPFLNTAPTLADGGTLAVKFYGLAFAPAGAVGVSTIPSGETLVGGDSTGELWVFPPTGAAIDVGNFGLDPDNAMNFLSLSGDLVFYENAMNQATGLATIRSCNKGTTGKVTCTTTNDFLAGINMANLKANATTPSSTPASLLGGIYGGSMTADGPGTGKAEIFGLGAWGTDVYGFSRCYHCYDGGANTPPALLQISTTGASAGTATVVQGSFPFTNGWSGAGVTTKVTITVTPPPPTMNPPPPK